MQLSASRLDGFAEHVRYFELPAIIEPRGALVEFDYRSLPFSPQRTFFIKDVSPGTVRGGHAHKVCEQLLVCVRGRLTVELAINESRARVILDRPTLGLYLGAGVWAQQTYETRDTELLVFASLPFDPSSYIRSDWANRS
jgi:UDP-2-acetamido-3-amino-2,3-dideoxy-glucuronate N-acetyltransferase